MDNQPDLTFYFALHQAQRTALVRYLHAVSTLTDAERTTRGQALARWAKGFRMELDEHHHVEDTFFFPSLRSKVPTAMTLVADLERDHRRLDELLARWPVAATALADPGAPFAEAQRAAVTLAQELHDFLHGHLDIEDQDVLPLFWRHYSADEYDRVFAQAVKKGKKAGMWFIAPFTVDCFPAGPERDAFLAS